MLESRQTFTLFSFNSKKPLIREASSLPQLQAPWPARSPSARVEESKGTDGALAVVTAYSCT